MTQSLKMYCANRLGASILGNLARLEKALGEESWSPFSTHAPTKEPVYLNQKLIQTIQFLKIDQQKHSSRPQQVKSSDENITLGSPE